MEYGDKPDVIVRGARTIGIEIRNFFLEDASLPDGEQIQRKAREAVVSKAHHLYQAQAGNKFELTFAFDRSVPIRDQTSVAQKIAGGHAAEKRNRTALARRFPAYSRALVRLPQRDRISRCVLESFAGL